MAKLKLTKDVVARLKPPLGKSDAFFWDEQLDGFGLRIQAGKKTWVVQFRVGRGQGASQRRLSFATSEQLDVPRAREKAGELLAEARLGHDPSEAKRERIAKSTQAKPITLVEAIELYLGKNAEHWARQYLRGHFEPMHGRALSAIDLASVARRLTEIAEGSGGYAANRARQALSAMFNWAIGKGLTVSNPVASTKPEIKEVARDRVLSDQELQLVWEHAGGGDYGAILKLLVLTGQRRNEVGAMRWSELDLEKALWSLPRERTKNGRPHDVPLSSEAIAILKGISEREGRDLVFGTREGPFSGWSKAKRELDERIAVAGEMKPWRIHDLRRTFATGLARQGVQLPVIERLLNHVSGTFAGIVGVYQRHEFAVEKRRALELWAEHIKQLTGPRSNVVSLHRGVS